MHPLAIKAGDSAYFSAAQLGGAFSDKIEHRLRIARRLRNYTKDFAGCGLSALIINQIGEMPDIFGSERHALIPQTPARPKRTCGFPAFGSPTAFTARRTEKITHAFSSQTRPPPRSTLCPYTTLVRPGPRAAP